MKELSPDEKKLLEAVRKDPSLRSAVRIILKAPELPAASREKQREKPQ